MRVAWDKNKDQIVAVPANVIAFLDAYEALCRKHGLSLSHEDSQGAFVVEDINVEWNIHWVRSAKLDLTGGR